jgi:hypothetical protein
MCKKSMESAIAEVIRETCHKEREENKARKSTNYLIVDEHAFQHVVTRSARGDFEYNWSTIVVREAR